MVEVSLVKEELRRRISEELEKLESITELTDIVKEIDEIKGFLDDVKRKLLEMIEPEEIDDELYEELDKISEELLKNPEKGLTAESAVKELLSS
jgi:hypothetical protein